MTRRLTRTLSARLTAIALGVAAATVVVLVATFNLLLARSVQHDVDARLRARAAAALTTLSVSGGRLRVGEGPDDAAVDSQIWVYGLHGALERPLAGGPLQRAADRLAGGPRRLVDVRRRDTRLYAVPVVLNGRRYGTVVAGVSLAGYDRTTDDALVGSALFAALVLVVVAGVTRGVIRSAVRPVAEMTAQAAEWSEHDLDHRFGAATRPEELDQLASTFDRLLDRLAASLRHEQRLSAELSHELRTPLARIVAETEMLLRRPRSLEEHRQAALAIHDSAGQMTRILETLMVAARAEAELHHGRSDVRAAAARARDSFADQASQRGVEIAMAPAFAPLQAGVDAQVVEGVLGPLLANACRHASARVNLAIRRQDGRVIIEVDDDGPGVAGEEVERIFEPGIRGSGAAHGSGAGLGLALARRLARAAGGDVRAEPSEAGGRFRVDLPAG